MPHMCTQSHGTSWKCPRYSVEAILNVFFAQATLKYLCTCSLICIFLIFYTHTQCINKQKPQRSRCCWCLMPPGTISEVKLNPLHLRCAAVCAADYPLTVDYAHFATHIYVLKPPPDLLMQLSTIIILNMAIIIKTLYISCITSFKYGLIGLYRQNKGLPCVTRNSLGLWYPSLQLVTHHCFWN